LALKPRNPALKSGRRLDQVHERVRCLHYSLSTKKVYRYLARFFIRWYGLRHPRDMGVPDGEALLTPLANECSVSAFPQSSTSAANPNYSTINSSLRPSRMGQPKE
jgi:hypothetical protein